MCLCVYSVINHLELIERKRAVTVAAAAAAALRCVENEINIKLKTNRLTFQIETWQRIISIRQMHWKKTSANERTNERYRNAETHTHTGPDHKLNITSNDNYTVINYLFVCSMWRWLFICASFSFRIGCHVSLEFSNFIFHLLPHRSSFFFFCFFLLRHTATFDYFLSHWLHKSCSHLARYPHTYTHTQSDTHTHTYTNIPIIYQWYFNPHTLSKAIN